MAEVQLDYAVPSADLAAFVTIFYHFRADLPLFEDVERADHAQFRFRLSRGAADYRFPNGSEQDAPAIHLIGATDGALRTRAVGPVEVFGMGLTPAGWHALMGGTSALLLNRVIDAEAAFGAVVGEAAMALGKASGRAAMVAIVEPLLRTLLAPERHGATLRFVAQVDAWLADSRSPEIAELVACAGVSRRQVERRCKAVYGFPPKLLARKYRALRAAVAIASGDEAIGRAADGFYDQSHMIREIKQFTGLTPGQMRDRPNLLAQLTMRQRRALAGQVGPLISDT